MANYKSFERASSQSTDLAIIQIYIKFYRLFLSS